MIDRRGFVLRLSGVLAGGLMGRRLAAQVNTLYQPVAITVYKSKTCGCCAEWVDHLRRNGFAPTVHDEEDMDRVKAELGVPEAIRSCHTALADKYLIEGHVPAAEIQRLLAQHPKVAGLAVPGMPSHSPGMAPPGARIEGFEVVAFQLSGSPKTFARY